MMLSNQQYQEIMKEYDQIRRDCQEIRDTRKEEIRSKIPEIRAIDDQMAAMAVSDIRRRLFGSADSQQEKGSGEFESLSARKTALLVKAGYPPDYLDPVYVCPDCRDTGYIGSSKCHCFQQRILALLYDQSNLRNILKEENFEHFDLRYYSDRIPRGESLSPRENIRKVLDVVQDYIRRFPQGEQGSSGNRNLLIYGRAGVGKTFLSHCIADSLLRKGHSVLYMTSHQFFEQLADHTFRREKADHHMKDFVLSCDLLIIDDLGTEMNNAFVNSSLFVCINERLLAGRGTIINTNLSLEQINKIYSERVFSRIIESYTPIHIFGEDIRIRKTVTDSIS